MRVAIIFLGKRVDRWDVPWLTPKNWDEIAKEANKNEEGIPEGYKANWKKVGNEYRIYIEKVA